MSLNPEDLQIEVDPLRPKGGQQVGIIPTAVKVTHRPTGLTASCFSARSQLKNRNVAMAMIEYGLAELGYETQ